MSTKKAGTSVAVAELRRAVKRARSNADYYRRWAEEQVKSGAATVGQVEYQCGWARGYSEMAKILERRADRLDRPVKGKR